MMSVFNGQKAAKKADQHDAVTELISYLDSTKLYKVIGSSTSDIAKWREAEIVCLGDRDHGILRGYKRWTAPALQDKRYYKFRNQCHQMLEELHARYSIKKAKRESILLVENLGHGMHIKVVKAIKDVKDRKLAAQVQTRELQESMYNAQEGMGLNTHGNLMDHVVTPPTEPPQAPPNTNPEPHNTNPAPPPAHLQMPTLRAGPGPRNPEHRPAIVPPQQNGSDRARNAIFSTRDNPARRLSDDDNNPRLSQVAHFRIKRKG